MWGDAIALLMPNKPRPRCPKDDAAMSPLFAKRVRGSGFKRAGEIFWCEEHNVVSKGRGGRAKFL